MLSPPRCMSDWHLSGSRRGIVGPQLHVAVGPPHGTPGFAWQLNTLAGLLIDHHEPGGLCMSLMRGLLRFTPGFGICANSLPNNAFPPADALILAFPGQTYLHMHRLRVYL